MFLIKTYLSKSAIHGLGVFAGEHIPKGTVISRMAPGFDQVWDLAEFEALPELAQDYIQRNGWLNNGKYYMNIDHGLFTNHSRDANVATQPDDSEVAVRDIAKGEEITCNYTEFNESFDECPHFEEIRRKGVG